MWEANRSDEPESKGPGKGNEEKSKRIETAGETFVAIRPDGESALGWTWRATGSHEPELLETE